MLAFTPLTALGVEWPSVSGAFSLGYDSNPAQRRDGPSLGFAQANLEVTQPLPLGLSLAGDLWLRDHAGHNDSQRLDLTVAWWRALGKTQLEFWGTTGWYRDQLVRADERDEAALGTKLTRVLSPRLDLAFVTERRWFAYRHRVLPWAGRPGGVALAASGPSSGGCGHGAGMGGGCQYNARRRDDRLDLLAADLTWMLSPRLNLILGVERAWRHSSIALDANDQRGARLGLGFDPSRRFGLTLELGASRLDYARAPQRIERVDHQRWVGLGVVRRQRRDQGVIFCQLDLLDSRSTIALETFTQWVGSCGYEHGF
jgi:hypothetical protein